MAKPTIICSLYIKNKKTSTRSIANGILGPSQSGLFHFKDLNQVNHVINLEKNNHVEIKTPIPSHIYSQIESSMELEVPDFSKVDLSKGNGDSLDKAPDDKPDWYLDWDQVEKSSKTELQEWFNKYQPEGLVLPKNKNAADTKEMVHTYLVEKFANDHAAPTIEEE